MTFVAKLPPETNAAQFRLMLQSLLTERFQIKLHREEKTLSVYDLVVAKNGPKLEPAEEIREYKDEEEARVALQKKADAGLAAALSKSRRGGSRGSFSLARATTAKFAQVLSSYVDRPIQDQTHLEGLYSFHVEWSPHADGEGVRDEQPLGPSLFDALREQLGLTLQPRKEQLEVLVIHHVEKIPLSN